jgi:hypothetical protein
MEFKFLSKFYAIIDPEMLDYVGIFKPMIQIHISFGATALIAGMVILASTKGSVIHKKIGIVFVAVMIGNFLLGTMLGSIGQVARGAPPNILTFLGSFLIGTLTFSGYRLVNVRGEAARGLPDKAMLLLQIVTSAVYFYVALLMVIGTDLFGLMAVTRWDLEQYVFSNNKYELMDSGFSLIQTTGGMILAVIISENFSAALVNGSFLAWFAFEDWHRIMGPKLPYDRIKSVKQHFARLITVFAGGVTAASLNLELVSFWVSWTFPYLFGFVLIYYFNRKLVITSGSLETLAYARDA